MGKKSQERMTGRTYEERVMNAKRFGRIRSFFRRIRRLDKRYPSTGSANTNRGGNEEDIDRLRKMLGWK